MGAFKEPHGGSLKQLYLGESAADEEKERARDYPSWDSTPRQLCDLELLLNGGFSPLEGFHTRVEYESVLADMRLPCGVLWPVPVVLDVSEAFAEHIESGSRVALRDPEGVPIAILAVEDFWQPSRQEEAAAVCGTDDPAHPGVRELLGRGPVYLGGRVEGLEPPTHYDFKSLRDTPSELRGRFRKLGWRRIVAFHTHDPIHRAELELTAKAAREVEASLLLHPIVAPTDTDGVAHFSRVRCYEQVLDRYPGQRPGLSLLGLATRRAGPRETLWHAIVRKNHGCTHLIVGRDHAGAGSNPAGNPFYKPFAAQALFARHEAELEIAMVPCHEMVYASDRSSFVPVNEVQPENDVLRLGREDLVRRLRGGVEIPEWFSFPEVMAELRKLHPPRALQGFVVFFTGLSGSGKSTIANALRVRLQEIGTRPVTLLDGDLVRKHLSSELGFSREHRDLNVQRIGYVASEIAKNGGIAICAPIAPYASTRRVVRDMVEVSGGFIEVHVATSLEVCESRDRKGLYAQARAGRIKGFTGIDDPYEEPAEAELRIDTVGTTPEGAAARVLDTLAALGFEP